MSRRSFLTTVSTASSKPYFAEQVLKLLIDQGAAVLASDEQGRAPLHSAARSNNILAARLLVESGADVMQRDFDGKNKIYVPVKKVVATSTTHIPMIEILGETNSLIGFPNTDYISSKKTNAREEKNLIKDLRQGQYSLSRNWNTLEDYEKKNMIRTISEVSYMIAASVLANILTNISDDDDEN